MTPFLISFGVLIESNLLETDIPLLLYVAEMYSRFL